MSDKQMRNYYKTHPLPPRTNDYPHYLFWTGGPIRHAIYRFALHLIRFLEDE